MTTKNKHIDWLNHGLEFMVVLIGILIAFQLNKCSIEKQQEGLIEIHLEQIYEEAEINKTTLKIALATGENTIAKLDTIFLLLSQTNDYDRINRLSIELLNLGGAYFRKNAFQNLTESGDIRFINEFDTKKRIINLYEYYKGVESFDEISRNVHLEDYYPYLKNNFDLTSGQTQEAATYQNKLFKNILASYKRTSENRIRKYKECIEEINEFLNIQSQN